MDTSSYRLSQQEAALKIPQPELGPELTGQIAALHEGIDKIKAEKVRLRSALDKLIDAHDAYFDDMGISPDDTPLSREVAEARKAL